MAFVHVLNMVLTTADFTDSLSTISNVSQAAGDCLTVRTLLMTHFNRSKTKPYVKTIAILWLNWLLCWEYVLVRWFKRNIIQCAPATREVSLERPVACNSFNPRRTRRLAVSIVLSVIGRRPVIVSPLYANNRCSKNVARVSLLLGVACLVALRVAILAESLCTGAPRGTAPIPVTESLASTDFPFGGCRHPTRLRNADLY